MTVSVALAATALHDRLDAWYDLSMTNNNRLTPEEIARLAASMRTANFNPTKGRTRPRTTHTRKNIR